MNSISRRAFLKHACVATCACGTWAYGADPRATGALGLLPRRDVQLGESLLDINARHEQLISGLLVLADSEKELTALYPVNLGDVVAHVVAQVTREASEAA